MIGMLDFKSNSSEVKKELHNKIQLALRLIGETAEGYAKKDCPVDTGRLRNSITYATTNSRGSGDSIPNGIPEEDAVYIGTNVEYAQYVEFLSRNHKVGKAHFLRDAATTHSSEYKKIAETVLKSK